MNRNTRYAAIAGAIIVAFLIGFLWQYMSARSTAERLRGANTELEFMRLETLLANATIEAYGGNHEVARQWASEFFTRLQAGVGRLGGEARVELDEILAHRDAAITSLSRADPQAGELLATLHDRFRHAVGRPPLLLPVSSPGPAGPPAGRELEDDTVQGAAP